jgi:hypothetical protein
VVDAWVAADFAVGGEGLSERLFGGGEMDFGLCYMTEELCDASML